MLKSKEKMAILKSNLKFLLFYNLYRFFNGLALKCYQAYWEALKDEEVYNKAK